MKPKDIDRLSAYIDQQLAPAEKAALEQRLGREPELRAALSELRLTVRALRSLPAVKAPRNFTLTPAQVGQAARPRRGAWFPTLRLATALSAVALAVVAGGDFAARRGVFSAGAPADAVILTTENSAGSAAQETLTATPAAEVAMLELADVTETLTAALSPGGGDVPPATEGTPSAAAVMAPATPTPSAERMAAETPSAEMAADADETATLDTDATPEAEGTDSTKGAPPEDTLFYGTAEATATATAPGFPSLSVLKATLAMLTVLLGLGAWLASRNT